MSQDGGWADRWDRDRVIPAAGAGVVSAALGLGIAEIVSALFRPEAAPTISVGNRIIFLLPHWVQSLAIQIFGTGDKTALVVGMYLVVGLLSAGVGVLALRRPLAAFACIAAAGAFAVWCSLTTNAPQNTDAVPSALAAVVTALMFRVLLRHLPEPAARPATAAVRTPARPGSLASKQQFTASGASRRRFIQLMGLGSLVALVSGFGGRIWQHARSDVAAARAAIILPPVGDAALAGEGEYDLKAGGEPFQTANTDFYRIDTAIITPQLDPKTWRLTIHGAVDKPITLTYADLLARPMIERWITMCCVSNDIGGDLVGTAKFQGVLLADLLREAGPREGADQLLSTSADGMTIGTPTAVVLDGRDAMLAVGMNGVVLPVAHGFPVRMVVPGLYGYVSACKWIVDIEVTSYTKQQAYWAEQGYAAKGPVLLASRIETPKFGTTHKVGQTVPIAGTAWQQHTGISKVQVQIDNGPWNDAELARVPSADTWVQWVYQWKVPSSGSHRVQVRAVDSLGQTQTSQVTSSFPSGATGLHSIMVRGS